MSLFLLTNQTKQKHLNSKSLQHNLIKKNDALQLPDQYIIF